MSSTYILHYFDGGGRGEPIRWLFAYAGQDFVDNRIELREWPLMKPKTPFGTLPYVEVDGQVLGELGTILRFLARRFNLYGQNPWEEARIDEIMDFVKDRRAAYPRYVQAVFFENQPEMAAQAKADYIDQAPLTLKKLEEILAATKHGVLVGTQTSLVDISVAYYFYTLERFKKGILDDYPTLRDHGSKIWNSDGIQKWLRKRNLSFW
ncbi:probable glutathione S-transferase 7 [Paramacrobiotus metropolitanus]|uniref:probable glutathione S-transferase 7 n=1 Tax=Paramacrobiotus metropolitanus TaxID=2943436 RepID=UPI002445AB68|nr:probable glutathione S-transferase 7 [Paramacrobiotus metropolitanus]